MAEVQRATVMALVEETTAGTLKSPSAAGEFIPLRAGFAPQSAVEELESDELLNDIGASEPTIGKETPTGTHPIYLKHSETEGQAPEYGIMIKSALGGISTAGAEYDTVSGSTTTVVNVDSGEGATFEEGEAVLVKDGTNGYSIRNIESISSDALTMNFALSNAPGAGVNLGQAVLYKPASSGHPSYSAWYYRANGGAIEAIAGCRTSSMTVNLAAGQLAEAEFSYEGSKFYYNPIEITASNKYIDITDDGGTIAVALTEKIYKSPADLAREIATKATAASVGSGNDTISCSYSSTTGKFTLSSDGSVFSLLWNTGVNTANSVGTTIGFAVAADDTGATSYVGDNAISFAAAYTPSYDDAQNIRVVQAELMIGDSTDNFCREASSVEMTIDSPTVEVEDICEESGVKERLPESRTVTVNATLTLKKYEVALFDKFINNTSTSVMVNVGPKSNDDWVAGKCVNIFMQRAKIISHVVGGDNFVTVEISAKGFVTSSKKDVYINFI